MALQLEFSGEIDSIYASKNFKYEPCISINGVEYLIDNDIFRSFSKGDMVVKRSGSLKYYWVKNGDTTVFYQQCGTEDIRDE
jgi:hypothetical protein